MTLEPGDVISTGTPQKLPEAQAAHRPLAAGDAVTVQDRRDRRIDGPSSFEASADTQRLHTFPLNRPSQSAAMDQRYATNPVRSLVGHRGSPAQYLVHALFVPGRSPPATPTTTGSCSAARCRPANTCRCRRSRNCARVLPGQRELGIVNVGGTGTVTADGETYTLANGACLYVGRGTREVVFAGVGEDQDTRGPQFYLFCAPAHTTYPTQPVLAGRGHRPRTRDQPTSNRRS